MRKTADFTNLETFAWIPEQATLSAKTRPCSPYSKVFDTLHFLVEHAGRLLEKDELMQTIWQDRFVEESNLTFNIKMLGGAGDDAHRPALSKPCPARISLHCPGQQISTTATADDR